MSQFDNLISGDIMFPRNPNEGTDDEKDFRNNCMGKMLRVEAHFYLEHTFKGSTLSGEGLGTFSQDFLEKWAALDSHSAKYNPSQKPIEWEEGV